MRALERANKVRSARAALKRELAFGELDIGAVILDCPWEARTMTVNDLLMSQPRWGAIRSRKLLAMLDISERKSIGSMTRRQCDVLATLLRSGSRSGPAERRDGLTLPLA
jgi:hypothetical protein